MRCHKCGAELLPNDNFCGSCGAKIVLDSNNVTASKPYIFTHEEKKTPYSGAYNVPSNNDLFSSNGRISNDNIGDKQPPQSVAKSRSKTSGIVVALVIILILLAAFTVFNFLLMTDKIDTFKYDMFEGYKGSLAEFLHLPYEAESEETPVESEKAVTVPEPTTVLVSSTQPVTQPSTVSTTAVTETTTDNLQSNIPSELQQYEGRLTYEGKAYRITLQEDDWYINYRSSPQVIDIHETPNNILGKLKSGSEIYVEYICDGTWAVFYKDGTYVFASLYSSNDLSKNRLMEIV